MFRLLGLLGLFVGGLLGLFVCWTSWAFRRLGLLRLLQVFLQVLFATVVCNCGCNYCLQLVFAVVVCNCCYTSSLQLLLHVLFAIVVTNVVCNCCDNCCLQLFFATVVCKCCYTYCLLLLLAAETQQSKHNTCLRKLFKHTSADTPPGHVSKQSENRLGTGSRGTPPPRTQRYC